ncbi:hypothetical protein [Paenibacillus sp. GYB003]|uniref:hypothetical protein n=1 Tax=Paenibacillus sp. GYB003 TaxID=2994392 RepID=UPI002F962A44
MKGAIPIVRIRFGSIEIDRIADSSSVNAGINVIIGRTAREQTNEALGTGGGKGNRIEAGQHVLRTKRPPAQTAE